MFDRAIHWFRRDLRISDNTALRDASRQSRSVIPLYTPGRWSDPHPWTGPLRRQFLCHSLEALENTLSAIGGRLLYRRGPQLEALRRLIRESGAEAVFFNRHPDPHHRAMDRELGAMCRELGIACCSFRDAVLHEGTEVLKADGTPYRVYTPYSKSWLELPKPGPGPDPGRLSSPRDLPSDPRPDLSTWNLSDPGVDLPAGGEEAARERLRTAIGKRLPRYASQRDRPAADATSRLSQDLRFGTISIRQVYHAAARARNSARPSSRRSSFEKFIAELAWREFYMQILDHFPEVLDLEFNPDWRGLPWEDPGEHFDRWKAGQTGFPIVDAGMRELAATGFLHNRVRMIVAMFLTKDLHLDWRLGEQFFMQCLIDGEIASNNGGWQWSAGTGADAAPYFRIQNPWTQTKRYDPEGAYIRRWVPELENAPAKALWTAPPPGQSVAHGYPPPIVDHAAERRRTLDIFKNHSNQRPQ